MQITVNSAGAALIVFASPLNPWKRGVAQLKWNVSESNVITVIYRRKMGFVCDRVAACEVAVS